MKELSKKLKMTQKNIKKKNLASIITIFIESLKVILSLIFSQKLNSFTLKVIYFYAIVSILIAIFLLFNDDYKKIYKCIILDLASGIFLFSNIIGGILIESIIIPIEKKILTKPNKKEKIQQLPIILYHKKIVYIYLFISILICYEFLYMNTIIFYILTLISLILFFKEDITISLKEFKKNIFKFISYILNNYIIMMFISNILFIIIGLIVKEEATNQTILNENLIKTAIIGILYAPIAEELLFRGCLRKIIKNNLLFVIVSGIGFGAWHVIGYNQNILQYLYIIPYSAMGICLSYIYSKSNNLTTNIGVHGLNNLVASIMNFM